VIDDPIVEELRAYRKAFAEAHGNDLMRIVQSLKAREIASNLPRVMFPPKVAQNIEVLSK